MGTQIYFPLKRALFSPPPTRVGITVPVELSRALLPRPLEAGKGAESQGRQIALTVAHLHALRFLQEPSASPVCHLARTLPWPRAAAAHRDCYRSHFK